MIKWDKPCYKCSSHFCDLSCKEPKHLQAPQRTWVGLTDEEIKEGESKGEQGYGFIQGALWAEAKLKEKNT